MKDNYSCNICFKLRVTESLRCLPVSTVHQVGQILLALPREWAQVFVLLEEV